jgi:hypothetical protein
MITEKTPVTPSPAEVLREQLADQLNKSGVATTESAKKVLLEHYEQALNEFVRAIKLVTKDDDVPLQCVVFGSLLNGHPRLGIYPSDVTYDTVLWRQNFKKMKSRDDRLDKGSADEHVPTANELAQLTKAWDEGIPQQAQSDPSDLDVAINVSRHPALLKIDNEVDKIAATIFARFGVLISYQPHISPQLTSTVLSIEELASRGGLQKVRSELFPNG